MVESAYKMCVGMFKQDSTGSVYGKIPSPYAAFKWNLTSIIPVNYDYTNFQVGDTTIETVEKSTITQLTKTKEHDSGAVDPPTFGFATLLPADEATIVSVLNALDVADPFKVLLCVGAYKSESSGTITYDVFNACCAILTADGGKSGEAKKTFGGNLGLKACHLPIIGATECAATMTRTSAGVVTLVPTVAGGGN